MSYRKQFKQEFKDAKKRLAKFEGELFWVDFDYEAFRFKSHHAHVIFYPHKTTAGNYHIRVRDAGSKDKTTFEEVCAALREGNHTCTFSRKSN